MLFFFSFCPSSSLSLSLSPLFPRSEFCVIKGQLKREVQFGRRPVGREGEKIGLVQQQDRHHRRRRRRHGLLARVVRLPWQTITETISPE